MDRIALRPALRHVAFAGFAVVVASCAPDATPLPSASTSEVGSLPANTWCAIAWNDAAPPDLLRLVERATVSSRGLEALLDARSGAIGVLAPLERGTHAEAVFVARLVDSDRAVRTIGEALPASWRLARDGRSHQLVRDAWPRGFEPVSARLSTQSWFRTAAGALGEGRGLQLFVNLAEMRDALPALDAGSVASAMSFIPGLTSFRSLALRIERANPDDANSAELVHAALALARTPTGIAKAIAVEPAPLHFASTLRAARDFGGTPRIVATVRIDPGVLVDSAGAIFAAQNIGGLGANPMAVLRSMRLGKILTRGFWSSFELEWGITLRQVGGEAGVCALARLRDRAQFLADLGEVMDEGGRPVAEDPSVELHARRIMGWNLRVYVGRDRVAIATRHEDELAIRLVGAESWNDVVEKDAQNAWLDVVPGALSSMHSRFRAFAVRDGSHLSIRGRLNR